MAASGINEHNEARRKGRFYEKQAHWRKQLEANPTAQFHGNNNNNVQGASGNSYEQEVQSRGGQCRVVGSPPGIDGHDPRSVDKYCDNVGRAAKNGYYNEKNAGTIKTDAYRCQSPSLNVVVKKHFLANPRTSPLTSHPGVISHQHSLKPHEDLHRFRYTQRRMDHYNRQQAEYSAKINGRYRNFDYLSQW